MGDYKESAGAEPGSANEQVSEPEAGPRAPEADGQAQVAELKDEVEKLREALLRARADMDNQQKRAAREMEKARRYQHEAIMRDLLPVIDGLEQGLESASEGDSAREGLTLTRRLLLKTLTEYGLEELDPAGERFDPQWHEAMSIQPGEEAEPDTVVMVLQKGYRLDDRLLRPARVIVAGGP